MLESYVKRPGTGLCELIWNAFDEDAELVEITVEMNDLGGLDVITVEDDGNGFTRERAETAFATVGDSWKRMPGTLSTRKKRPVHGKHGRGRYAAFGLGKSVQWRSTATAIEDGEMAQVTVSGSASDLQHMDIGTGAAERDTTGTRVRIGMVTEDAQADFDQPDTLRTQVLTEFALHLERFSDFSIVFLGDQVDASSAIDSREVIPLTLPQTLEGPAELTIIEWKLSDVERRMYLCSTEGSIVDEIPPGIQAPGAEFTAYLKWDGFHAGDLLTLEGDTESPAGQVIATGRDALRDHLAKSSRRREAETVSRWKAEGVYPYRGEPKDSVEGATRDVFNVVAMAAARTVEESKSPRAKALSLSLLKQTLETDPESLLPIMHEVAKLPASRIEELQEILRRTTLAHLIQVGKEVGNRVEFLNGLGAILFEKQYKRRLLERRQLHRILAHETWLFGEEWSLTGDDDSLDIVLKKYRAKLGNLAELTSDKTNPEAPVRREDGSIAIPDLVLGRTLETNAETTTHLVVELKRPNHPLDLDDLNQISSYASAIVNDERFNRPNVTWDFWLVGNETNREADERRTQEGLPLGLAHNGKKYKIWVKTWSEVIGAAEHRLKFVQRSLQFESTRDTGLAHMRERYAEYLPDEPAPAEVPIQEEEDGAVEHESA